MLLNDRVDVEMLPYLSPGCAGKEVELGGGCEIWGKRYEPKRNLKKEKSEKCNEVSL